MCSSDRANAIFDFSRSSTANVAGERSLCQFDTVYHYPSDLARMYYKVHEFPSFRVHTVHLEACKLDSCHHVGQQHSSSIMRFIPQRHASALSSSLGSATTQRPPPTSKLQRPSVLRCPASPASATRRPPRSAPLRRGLVVEHRPMASGLSATETPWHIASETATALKNFATAFPKGLSPGKILWHV